MIIPPTNKPSKCPEPPTPLPGAVCPHCASDQLRGYKRVYGTPGKYFYWWEVGIECTARNIQRLPTGLATNPPKPDPAPLEHTHPGLAEHLRLIANGEHPAVISMDMGGYGQRRGYRMRQLPKPPGRNEPCHCGSGLKYKRCHG